MKLEIRPSEGGDDSVLFMKDLFGAIKKYADKSGVAKIFNDSKITDRMITVSYAGCL